MQKRPASVVASNCTAGVRMKEEASEPLSVKQCRYESLDASVIVGDVSLSATVGFARWRQAKRTDLDLGRWCDARANIFRAL